jgi:outer membrane protein OmpA-like peptidoglycan-associated protein
VTKVASQVQGQPTTAPQPAPGFLQRQCACGNHSIGGGECAECAKKKGHVQRKRNNHHLPQAALAAAQRPLVQPKLAIGASNDPLEREADRVAEQVLATPVRRTEGSARPHIQRFTSQRAGLAASAPASVDRVLASRGRPLAPALRQEMEARFGQDFSTVQVHTDGAAGQSAHDINANAYTAGNHIVFGAGRFAPETQTGRLLLAHELAHVVQQSAFTQSASGPGSQGEGLDSSLSAGPESAAPGEHTPVARPPQIIQRQNGDGEEEEEAPLTRSEEIALSRTSPGEYTGQTDPLALSLYNFGIDIAQPKAEHQAVLVELGTFLNALSSPETVVRVIGFADESGGSDYNLNLSRRRADEVAAILRPLTTLYLAISAFGESNPAASNETVAGRSRNRRVDIRFFANRPPPAQPPPRPIPTPPGQEPPGPQPPGPPPGPQPPGGGEDDFCADYPLLCGIGIIPFFLPLICVVAPELCLSVTCILAPELCLVPPPPGEPPGEPPERPEGDGRPVVIFVPLVRASNTPAGLNDRIGLRDAISVTAVVVNPPPLTNPITIEVDGTGSNGGVATINGQAQIQITGTTPLEILGTQMSAANFFYNPYLQLAAWWSNDLVGASNRFAVSSIAENWSTTFAGANRGRHGYVYMADMGWESDSGSRSDLNSCYYVELVGVDMQTGGMAGMGPGEVDDPADADSGDFHPAFDEHGTPFEYTRVKGYSRLKQLWRIRDERSNSGWAPSPNSGFEIIRQFERDPANPRCWHLVVTKRGAAVDIDGMSTGAGSGRRSYEWRHINCDPPPPEPEVPEPSQPEPQEPEPELPQPEPEEPQPSQPERPSGPPPCDREELARRVDQCIEQARQAAIDCTLDLLPFRGGWGGIGKGIEYYICLERMRRALLECDRRAKEDTNCQDAGPPPPPPEPEQRFAGFGGGKFGGGGAGSSF